MTPEEVRQWIRILRDFALVTVGSFMLVHETLWSSSPNAIIVGAGLTLVGIPPVLRLDERLGGPKDRE